MYRPFLTARFLRSLRFLHVLRAAALVLPLAWLAPAAAADEDAADVLIVCEHGSVKSLIAASLFNREARARGLPFRAVSRGVTPDDKVPAKIVEAMRGDGFDVAAYRPRPLTPDDVAHAVQIVTIGEEVRVDAPASGATVRRWNAIPAASLDYPAARDALRAEIATLLDRLASARRK